MGRPKVTQSRLLNCHIFILNCFFPVFLKSMKQLLTSKIRLQQQFEGFLNTPPIWQGSDFGITQFEMPIENDLHYTGEQLPENLYLGKRAERFLEDVLNQSDRYEVLASNIQIIENKRTIGELDFIVYDNFKKQTIHLEQVCKFYVYDSSLYKDTDRWIGPNRKDSLQQKLDKLTSHQFPLLYHPITQNILLKLGIEPENIIQQTCFKAFCFLPLGATANEGLKDINPSTAVGHYLSYNDFVELASQESQYYIPKKIDWAITPEVQESWFTFSQISEQLSSFNKEKRAPLVWQKKDHEYLRFFVVSW